MKTSLKLMICVKRCINSRVKCLPKNQEDSRFHGWYVWAVSTPDTSSCSTRAWKMVSWSSWSPQMIPLIDPWQNWIDTPLKTASSRKDPMNNAHHTSPNAPRERSSEENINYTNRPTHPNRLQINVPSCYLCGSWAPHAPNTTIRTHLKGGSKYAELYKWHCRWWYMILLYRSSSLLNWIVRIGGAVEANDVPGSL